jgi:hypothetical protein
MLLAAQTIRPYALDCTIKMDAHIIAFLRLHLQYSTGNILFILVRIFPLNFSFFYILQLSFFLLGEILSGNSKRQNIFCPTWSTLEPYHLKYQLFDINCIYTWLTTAKAMQSYFSEHGLNLTNFKTIIHS